MADPDLGSASQAIKHILKAMAPPGTWRRAVLRSLGRLARLGRPPAPSGPPAPPRGAEDPYNLRAINRILIAMNRPPLRARRRPRPGQTEAARWVLTTLMRRADLRRRYPQALRGGPDGGFCRELCANLAPESAADVRAVLARRLEKRPRQRYEVLTDYRQAFPLALTPAGRAAFLIHLLYHAEEHIPLSDEEILWFHLHAAEDPHQGLLDSYLLSPSWQERFPDALTRRGWDRFRAWLREEYVVGKWIDRLPNADSASDSAAIVGDSLRESPPGVNILAHFRYPSGLCEAARNTVQALQLAGVRRSCRDLPTSLPYDIPGAHPEYFGLEHFDVTLLHAAPDQTVDHWYERAGLWRRPGVHRIGVWYWELETAPPEWAAHAERLHEIWAPTRFIYDALCRVMPIPVRQMLPGIVPPVAPDLARSRFGLDDSRFLFLFVFDMQSVMERKNPLAVVAAFREAFAGSRDVQLAIKASRGAADPEDRNRLQQACDEAGCVLIDALLTREESYGLLNACDCYVSLHRSEGFGLTMAEAMFLAKPVIATGYSGNLDFMSADNSLLIPYELTPLPRDYGIYKQGCVWAEPSVPAAAEAMRWVLEHPAEAHAMGERARRHVTETLSLEAYGRRMRGRLEELRGERALRVAAALERVRQ